jgi:hypothetical protein
MKYIDRYTIAQIICLIIGLSAIWFIPISDGYETHIDNGYKGEIFRTVNTTIESQDNMISVHVIRHYNIYGLECAKFETATKFVYVPNPVIHNVITVDKDHLDIVVTWVKQ